MGSTNSQTEITATPMNNKKVTQDPRYGGMFHISTHTATAYQQIILEERNLPSLVQLANRRKKLQHPHLLTVTQYLIKNTKSNGLRDLFVCEGQPRCELYLTLEDLIQEHNQQKKIIPQKDVVNIFKAIVEALDFLKKNGTCHGDVKAGSILFDHLGNPKLIDSYFIHGGKTAYEIVLENPASMSLLAPEQLQNIKHRKFQDLTTIHLSQMFAVGLTMIQAMTFEAAMQCYNLQTLQIKQDYYEWKEKQLYSIGYSYKLCELVLACLNEQPKERPSFEQFLKIIQDI